MKCCNLTIKILCFDKLNVIQSTHPPQSNHLTLSEGDSNGLATNPPDGDGSNIPQWPQYSETLEHASMIYSQDIQGLLHRARYQDGNILTNQPRDTTMQEKVMYKMRMDNIGAWLKEQQTLDMTQIHQKSKLILFRFLCCCIIWESCPYFQWCQKPVWNLQKTHSQQF